MSSVTRIFCSPLIAVCLACCATSVYSAEKVSARTQAWELLRTGVQDSNTELRATAVGALSLLRGEPEAIQFARQALHDEKPEVRTAGATALGGLRDYNSIPKLKQALSDKEVEVVLAAAQSLVQLKDRSGYEVYYTILSGQRKKGRGLIAGQLDKLKDPKKMAEFGFRQGIGFVPFGGLGYRAIKTLVQSRDDFSPVRAAAAKVLVGDPDPDTDDVLVEAATGDKSEIVRMAALEALARRGHPAMVEKIRPAMEDNKDSVKYTAAAAVLRLSDLGLEKSPGKNSPKK